VFAMLVCNFDRPMPPSRPASQLPGRVPSSGLTQLTNPAALPLNLAGGPSRGSAPISPWAATLLWLCAHQKPARTRSEWKSLPDADPAASDPIRFLFRCNLIGWTRGDQDRIGRSSSGLDQQLESSDRSTAQRVTTHERFRIPPNPPAGDMLGIVRRHRFSPVRVNSSSPAKVSRRQLRSCIGSFLSSTDIW